MNYELWPLRHDNRAHNRHQAKHPGYRAALQEAGEAISSGVSGQAAAERVYAILNRGYKVENVTSKENMRTLTDHIVSGDQAVQLRIEVIDEPGAGGANHEYRIVWDGPEGVGYNAEGELVAGGRRSITISFQNGPIKEFGVNGITQEALIAICIDRLREFQKGPFSCKANQDAQQHLHDALYFLQQRTCERIARDVEGTNQK